MKLPVVDPRKVVVWGVGHGGAAAIIAGTSSQVTDGLIDSGQASGVADAPDAWPKEDASRPIMGRPEGGVADEYVVSCFVDGPALAVVVAPAPRL